MIAYGPSKQTHTFESINEKTANIDKVITTITKVAYKIGHACPGAVRSPLNINEICL